MVNIYFYRRSNPLKKLEVKFLHKNNGGEILHKKTGGEILRKTGGEIPP
jgi:hypothetical protein